MKVATKKDKWLKKIKKIKKLDKRKRYDNIKGLIKRSIQMVTDETLREIVLKEKRKLFMRLYMTPWIGLTIALIIIIGVLLISSHYTTAPITPAPVERILNSEFQNDMVITGTNQIKEIYKEAVNNGVGEWKVDNNGEVTFKWKPSTESIIASQVQDKVNIRIKALQDSYKTNAIEILEKVKKETSTECLKGFQIGAVSNGVGEWISDINGKTEFRWKSIPEIVNEYISTESNKLTEIGMVKRELPFTIDNYRVARNVGMDIEGELIKRVSLGIETVFWGNRDNELKERVKIEVSKSIHGMFDGFETLNRVDKRYNIK
jgi:hypothetical protein